MPLFIYGLLCKLSIFVFVTIGVQAGKRQEYDELRHAIHDVIDQAYIDPSHCVEELAQRLNPGLNEYGSGRIITETIRARMRDHQIAEEQIIAYLARRTRLNLRRRRMMQNEHEHKHDHNEVSDYPREDRSKRNKANQERARAALVAEMNAMLIKMNDLGLNFDMHPVYFVLKLDQFRSDQDTHNAHGRIFTKLMQHCDVSPDWQKLYKKLRKRRNAILAQGEDLHTLLQEYNLPPLEDEDDVDHQQYANRKEDASEMEPSRVQNNDDISDHSVQDVSSPHCRDQSRRGPSRPLHNFVLPYTWNRSHQDAEGTSSQYMGEGAPNHSLYENDEGCYYPESQGEDQESGCGSDDSHTSPESEMQSGQRKDGRPSTSSITIRSRPSHD